MYLYSLFYCVTDIITPELMKYCVKSYNYSENPSPILNPTFSGLSVLIVLSLLSVR